MTKMFPFLALLFSLNTSLASDYKSDIAIQFLLGERDYDGFLNKTEEALNREKLKILQVMRELIDDVRNNDPTSGEIAQMEGLFLDVKNADLLMEKDLRRIFSDLENKYGNHFTDAELVELKRFFNSDIRRKFAAFLSDFLADFNSGLDNHGETVYRKLRSPQEKLVEIIKAVDKRKRRNEMEAPTPLELYVQKSGKNIIIADSALNAPSPTSDLFEENFLVVPIDNYELIVRKTNNLDNLLKNIQTSKSVIAQFLPPRLELKSTFQANSVSLDSVMVSYAFKCQLPLQYSKKIMAKFKFVGILKLNGRLGCESLVYILASNGFTLSKTGSKLAVTINTSDLRGPDDGVVTIINVR